MPDALNTVIGAGIGLYVIDKLGRRRRRYPQRSRTNTKTVSGTYKAFSQLTKTQKAYVKKQMKPPYTGRVYRIVGGKVVSRK